MSEIKNAESVRNWLRTGCPHIDKNARFSVDYLSEKAGEYSVIIIPSVLRTRPNILGEEVPLDEQEQSFFFAARLSFTQDIRQSIENHAFFQNVIEWIWAQNAAKNFPDWDGGRIRSIVPTLTEDIVEVSSSTATYRIQLKVTYRRN